MFAKTMPSIEQLRAAFALDAERGVLLRNKSYRQYRQGDVCGTKMASGHLQTFFDGKRYLVHRLMYFMATGVDPLDHVVDHINGVPNDNRLSNLRLATKQENSRHKIKLCSTNTSKHRNVSWCRSIQRWKVSIGYNNKRVQRQFVNLDDAVRCAHELRKTLFGNFAGVTQ
jgi:hypothetical protein